MFHSSILRFLLLFMLVAAITGEVIPKCDSNDEFKLPDPTSCQHYYQCKNGVATRHRCSWYKYFDNVVMDCQKMWIVDCDAIPPEFPPAAWWPDN